MLVNLLIFTFLFSIPIYSLVKMIRSFSKENKPVSEEAIAKREVIEVLILLVIFCLLLLGYFFNSQGVVGGDPLRVDERHGMSINGYAPLSNLYIPTVFAFFIFSLIAYMLLTTKMGRLSPIIYVVCSSLLIVNILFTLIYFTHTGFTHYGDSIDVGGAVILFQFGYGSLSLLYIAKLNESLKQFIVVQQEQNSQYTNKFLRLLSTIALNYEKIPVLGMLFLFPVIVIFQFILVLLGQRPDSFIQVFSGYK